jgi:hypothetical protein
MTSHIVRHILAQAEEVDTVKWIFFEGGEPFLYYPVLVQGVREAARLGFQVGILSNCYWATDFDDALEWLRPFTGLIQSLTISSDLFHYNERLSIQAKNASAAAGKLSIPVGLISIAPHDAMNSYATVGQLPVGESPVMYRGRAAAVLAEKATQRPWTQFTECVHESLRDPERVHVDPFGNLHICQGLLLGNLFRRPLDVICREYDPDSHEIIGPLLHGGPVELVRRYKVPHEETYADECHLCYEARKLLRSRFPDVLGPDQMYGAGDKQ